MPRTGAGPYVCERRASAGIMILHGIPSANSTCHPGVGGFAHPDGPGAGGLRAAAAATDRAPDRQADVRVPQGFKRLQVPDGRGVAGGRRSRPAQEGRAGTAARGGFGVQSQASVSAPGQTIEAQADVGAAEAPTAGSEPYPPESPISSSEPAPTIQPPRTGEQVSGSAPFSATEGEVNPEADAEADAAEIEARAAGIEAQAAAPASNGAVSSAPLPGHPDQPNGQDPSLGSPKEPVSQHG